MKVLFGLIMEKSQFITHPISPFFDSDSKVLVLGSFPSVKSREQGFFYGNPQNRFWQVLSKVFDDEIPATVEQKKMFLKKHNVALYDVIFSCEITGSSDSSIKNVKPSDVSEMVSKSKIKKVFLNGKTAGKLYEKYLAANVKLPFETLPSTSPANAAFSVQKLVSEWEKLKNT